MLINFPKQKVAQIVTLSFQKVAKLVKIAQSGHRDFPGVSETNKKNVLTLTPEIVQHPAMSAANASLASSPRTSTTAASRRSAGPFPDSRRRRRPPRCSGCTLMSRCQC
jgi:hypothetical protein